MHVCTLEIHIITWGKDEWKQRHLVSLKKGLQWLTDYKNIFSTNGGIGSSPL